MSKTILAEVDGFTPLIDYIVDHHGIMTAAVFGRIWRYCQYKSGVCYAKMSTIGDELKLDRNTIMKHVSILIKAGYLEDLTPDLSNRPHTYFDTGKVVLEIGIGVRVKEPGAEINDSTAKIKGTAISDFHYDSLDDSSVIHVLKERLRKK